MWLENSLLISMCAVGILIPQRLWLARAYALKSEEGLEVSVIPRGVELFAFDAGLAAGVAAQLIEYQTA